MIYGEKVRYAREKLGMSRAEFADMLGMSKDSIANIETCKDERLKLSFDRMLTIITKANLPKGWFFFDDDEIKAFIVDGNDVYVRGDKPTDDEIREVLSVINRLMKHR